MRGAILVLVLVGCGGPAKGGATEPTSDRGGDQDRLGGSGTESERPAKPNAAPGGAAYATQSPGPNAGGPSPLPAPGPRPSPTDTPTPTPIGGPGLAPSAGAGSIVVIATITDAGPIGDGRCSQRSYELSVAKTIAGSVPAKLWAHFERCGDQPSAPAAGNLAGTGLAIGTTYQLTLKQGASKNFGDGFMIVDARTP